MIQIKYQNIPQTFYRFLLTILLFSSFLGSCSGSNTSHGGGDDDAVVVVVNGENILAGTFKKEMKLVKQKYKSMDQEVFKPEELLLLKIKTLNGLVQALLFEQEAKKHNIRVTEEQFQDALQQAKNGYPEDSFEQVFEIQGISREDWEKKLKNSLLTKNLINTMVNSKVSVAEEELATYFESHSKEFHKPKQIRTLHIMVATEEEARDILKRLERRGSNFSNLAVEYSQGPEGPGGGDLGYFQADQMPEEFESVFNLKMGKISDVVRTPYGFHIFKVVDKKPEHIMSFEESKKLIQAKLLQQRQEGAFHKWAKQIQEHAHIEINNENYAQIN